MDEESLKKVGTHIGTAGIMVMDEDTDLLKVLLRIAHFYHHESCGQCTPCREGCGWMEKILKRIYHGDGTTEEESTEEHLEDIRLRTEGNSKAVEVVRLDRGKATAKKTHNVITNDENTLVSLHFESKVDGAS